MSKSLLQQFYEAGKKAREHQQAFYKAAKGSENRVYHLNKSRYYEQIMDKLIKEIENNQMSMFGGK